MKKKEKEFELQIQAFNAFNPNKFDKVFNYHDSQVQTDFAYFEQVI